MTTLAAGSSVTVTLANNGFLEIATNGGFGSVTITPTSGAAVTESFGPAPYRKRWSGYPEGASAVLSNTSAAAFDYETDSTNLPSTVQALVSRAGIQRTVVIFGDSHSRRNGPAISGKSASLVGYELGDVFAAPTTDAVYFGFDGYFVAANTILNGAFRVLHNAAVGGETAAQINARIDTAMQRYQPAFAVYMAGTNDIQNAGITTAAAADTAAAATIADIAAGWARITSYGAGVLAYTIPPRTSLNGFQRRAWAQVNSWIRTAARRTANVYLAGDAARAAGNPATGDWLAATEYGAVATANSGDNIHATNYGYYLIGAESAQRLAALFALPKRPASAAPELAYDATNGNNPFGNLVSNGKMLGTAGAAVTSPATGSNLPLGWSIQGTPTAPSGGTIVFSKVSRAFASEDATTFEQPGEWLQVAMTGGTTAGIVELFQELPTSAQGPWVPGDVLSASLQFEEDATNWGQASVGAFPPIFTIELRNAGGIIGQCGFGLNGAPVVNGRIPAGTAITPEVQIPAGTTRIFLRIRLRGQGTWRISDADCRRVTDRT